MINSDVDMWTIPNFIPKYFKVFSTIHAPSYSALKIGLKSRKSFKKISADFKLQLLATLLLKCNFII